MVVHYKSRTIVLSALHIFYKASEKKSARAERRLSKTKQNFSNREKMRHRVARISQKNLRYFRHSLLVKWFYVLGRKYDIIKKSQQVYI